jgi:DeoR/GlpR family transcriptional regulator of sugar metabolism
MRYERLGAISRRHQALLALIQKGSYSSLRLAEELGVSAQTVYRDVLFLKRQGYPIKSVRVLGSWAYQFLKPAAHRQHSHSRAS